jgi:hypothetical protein
MQRLMLAKKRLLPAAAAATTTAPHQAMTDGVNDYTLPAQNVAVLLR